MDAENTQKGDSPPLHAKGMFLPASGIDPSLARATKPAPGLLFISIPQKRPLVAVLNERGVEKGMKNWDVVSVSREKVVTLQFETSTIV